MWAMGKGGKIQKRGTRDVKPWQRSKKREMGERGICFLFLCSQLVDEICICAFHDLWDRRYGIMWVSHLRQHLQVAKKEAIFHYDPGQKKNEKKIGIIHCLEVSERASKRKSEQGRASEWVCGAREWANGWASDPVLPSGFLIILDHSVLQIW